MLYYLYMLTDNQNFNTTLNLFEKNMTQSELMQYLKTGNIAQKQVCALKLEYLENIEQAKILVQNLTGQDGKIREAVAHKVNELIPQYPQYFLNNEIFEIFTNAILDINSNVCRNVISAILNLKNNPDFCNYFTQSLIKKTMPLIEIVKKIDFKDGKYKVNKEAFKLYWCLETIAQFRDKFDLNDIKQVVIQTKGIEEYTIREKTAKILAGKFGDNELKEIKAQLKNDDNYYVKRCLK